MMKQTVVYLYNEIPWGKKKEWNWYVHLNYAQMRYSKRKKPDSKGHLLYDSTHMAFLERQNCKDRKQIVGHQGLVREVDYKEVQGNLFCLMELFYILIVMGVTLLYTFAKTQKTVYCEG